jgi:pantetheine-phosphate adenylyltransferase
MFRKAIYPGTFDPVTLGHYDIARRALKMFDELIIAVAPSREKSPIFDLELRIKMAQNVFAKYDTVTVKPLDMLLVDFAEQENTQFLIRGLRAVSDFEYELQMGYANQSLNHHIETVYLMPSLEYAFISSSVVRSIYRHHGKVDHLVPKEVLELL